MNVQLKQIEIVAALTGYLAAQGIATQGKTISIDFTAGRKASGITADITIEDAPVTQAAFVPVVVASADPVVLAEPQVQEQAAAADPVPVDPVDEVARPTVSLFG